MVHPAYMLNIKALNEHDPHRTLVYSTHIWIQFNTKSLYEVPLRYIYGKQSRNTIKNKILFWDIFFISLYGQLSLIELFSFQIHFIYCHRTSSNFDHFQNIIQMFLEKKKFFFEFNMVFAGIIEFTPVFMLVSFLCACVCVCVCCKNLV